MSKPDPNVAAALELVRAMGKPQLQELSALLLAELGFCRAEQLTRDELWVRAGILAGRAPKAGHYGRVVCPVCGRDKSPVGLQSHIFRQHADQLAQMPAEVFKPRLGDDPDDGE
jgi:hypothetical protein